MDGCGRSSEAVTEPAAEDQAGLPDRLAELVFSALQDERLYWRSRQAARDEVMKPNCDEAKMSAAITKALVHTGLRAEIKTFASHHFERVLRDKLRYGSLMDTEMPMPPIAGPLSEVCTLDSVEWARQRWADLTLLRLRDLSAEQKQPFLRFRPPPSGHGEEDEVCTRYVVDLDDLFKIAVVDVNSRNLSKATLAGSGLGWGCLKLQLHADSLAELRDRFRELSPWEAGSSAGMLGVPRSTGLNRLMERRYSEGQALLATRYAPDLRAFARLGVPPALRREVWQLCLEIADDSRPSVLNEVTQSRIQWEWLTDDVLRLDVAELCGNDVCYFPFDEIVESMVLALSRDIGLCDDCFAGQPQVPLAAGPGPHETPAEQPRASRSEHLVPPSGIVPFRCFCAYACPFAFLSERLEVCYPILRAFYCQHLSRLHSISCRPGTLLPLCALFESLVHTTAPHVGYHLAQLGPEAAPLRIAFPWIVRGFVGFLRADQVLWLWDRVLGFRSTELIAVLAAAIVVFRAKLLMSTKRPEDVALVFTDLTALQAIPLLQHFLFAEEGKSFEV